MASTAKRARMVFISALAPEDELLVSEGLHLLAEEAPKAAWGNIHGNSSNLEELETIDRPAGDRALQLSSYFIRRRRSLAATRNGNTAYS